MKTYLPIFCMLLAGTATAQVWNQNQQTAIEIAAFKKAKVHTCTLTVQEYKGDSLLATYVSRELEYDNECRLVKEKWNFDAKGKVFDIITYQYDAQGRVVYETWEEHPKTEMSGNDETYYTYENGVLVKNCVKDPVEAKEDCIEYVYENGKLVKEVSYLDGSFVFEYKDGKVYRHEEGPDGEKNVTVYEGDHILEYQHGHLRYFYTYNAGKQLVASYSQRDGKKITDNTFTYKNNLPHVNTTLNLEKNTRNVETSAYTYY